MTRVGLIGYGSSGAGFHAPLLRAAGLDVVAVVTTDPERAAAARGDHPGVEVVPDVPALLSTRGLDLVVVASPSGRHVEHAAAALEAGIAVVVDKPLACDASAAQGLVDLATGHGVPLTVFQNRRYDPEFATMRDLLHRRVLGEPRRTELRWERWRPVPKDRWREQVTSAEGGGLLAEKKKTERVAPGVPVTVYRVGEGKDDGVIEIRKLTSRVQRMRPALTKDQVVKVNQRLRALGGVKLPVPQGIDPMRVRPDRKAMRGR